MDEHASARSNARSILIESYSHNLSSQVEHKQTPEAHERMYAKAHRLAMVGAAAKNRTHGERKKIPTNQQSDFPRCFIDLIGEFHYSG